MELQGQCAIITGGASGLGKATREALLARGVEVMVWDKETASLGESAISCDVSDAASVKAALATTLTRMGVPRICINCAGIAPAERMVGKTSALSFEAFQRIIDINLLGTFQVMSSVSYAMTQLEPLEASGERGIVINTASIAAFEGQIGQVAYSASKGGIVAMTLPAARELAQYGIRVNTIAPGLMATPLLLGMPQAVQDRLVSNVPFPKRFGHPEEFAALVLHLIENKLINGEVIRLDGGLRMQAR